MSKAMAANKPRVQYKDLRDYLKLLESAGLLHRIKAEVDLHDEIGGITASPSWIKLAEKGRAT